MGRTASSTSQAIRKRLEEEVKHRRKLAAAASSLAGLAVTHYANPLFKKTPMHTSILSGENKMQELIHGHPLTFYDLFGMSIHVFHRLVHNLHLFTPFTHSKHVTMIEQLGIFLYVCRKAASVRDAMYMFQRSPDTISKYFYRLLHCITSKPFYMRYVKLPPPDRTPPEIRSNPKFFPFFKDVLGAIDGTHISAFVADADLPRFRNRKGEITQNVLVSCTMDGRVSFVLSGWEGSATDARVLEDARRRGFIIPPGKKYLADAGYSLQDSILPPYRKVRYHLKEWGRASERPQNYKELYNLRHSSARNVIERTFGVIKRRYRITAVAPQYDFKTQARIIHAVCTLHNFVVCHDPSDATVYDVAEHSRVPMAQRHDDTTADDEDADISALDDERDGMAKDMWEQYIKYVADMTEATM